VHAVDVVVLCAAAVIVVCFVLILARQRFILRVPGGVPLALRVRGHRWLYGVARYAGGELRWYRSLGVGTRPSRVLRRSQLTVIGHRSPVESELLSLPAAAVVVECRDGDLETILAFGQGAYTGFTSWLEASAPRS
jgi:hypothetical protein